MLRKIYLILTLVFFKEQVIAQYVPEILERDAFQVGFFHNSPTGNFRNKLQNDFINVGTLGFSLSYMRNPLLKADNISHVFVGAEWGISGKKQNSFKNMPPDGVFSMNHREHYLFFKGKYLSKVTPEKFIPFIDVQFGPRLFASSFVESLGNDEIEKFYSYYDLNFSYGADAGFLIKVPGEKKSSPYLSFSVGYVAGNSIKFIDRNKVGLDQNYNVIEPLLAGRPQNIFIKLQYINFR